MMLLTLFGPQEDCGRGNSSSGGGGGGSGGGGGEHYRKNVRYISG